VKTIAALVLLAASGLAIGQSAPLPVKGQVLYLPIYSHIRFGDPDRQGRPGVLLVSAMVSIRNVDPRTAIRLVSADYYDSSGTRLKAYVTAPVIIRPLAAYELYVPKSDASGGSGASFVISWQSEDAAQPPVVEAIHAEVLGTRGLAFTTTARPIEAK
jgi:Protein of unknown function (DUF3124)